MSKRDNFPLTLMMYSKVNLECDEEKLQCRYKRIPGKEYGTWWINGEDKGIQCIELIKKLKEKYKIITVLWKSR